jgi:hypothetical protein
MDDKTLEGMIYVMTKHEVVMMAHKVQGLNLKKALAAISMAETMGPLLDPTLYRNAQMDLHWDERLLCALLEFQVEAATIFREIDLWQAAKAEKENQQGST